MKILKQDDCVRIILGGINNDSLCIQQCDINGKWNVPLVLTSEETKLIKDNL